MASDYVYVTYEESCVESSHEGGTGPFEGYSTESWEYEVAYVSRSKPDTPYFESIKVEDAAAENLHVVWVNYSTGSTFGGQTGRGHIVGAYSNKKEAMKIRDQIKGGTFSGYKPWDGYFESLEGVHIGLFEVH